MYAGTVATIVFHMDAWRCPCYPIGLAHPCFACFFHANIRFKQHLLPPPPPCMYVVILSIPLHPNEGRVGWDHVIVSLRRTKRVVRIDGTSEVSIRKTHWHRSTRREANDTWTWRVVLHQPRIQAIDTRDGGDGVARWNHGMRLRRFKMKGNSVAKRTIGASIGAVREAGLRWSGTDLAHLRRIRTDGRVLFVLLSSTNFLRTDGILTCPSFASPPSTTHERDPPSPPPCPRGVCLPRSLPPPADAPCFVLRIFPLRPSRTGLDPRGCAIHTPCGGGSQAPPSLQRCFASSEKTSPSLSPTCEPTRTRVQPKGEKELSVQSNPNVRPIEPGRNPSTMDEPEGDARRG